MRAIVLQHRPKTLLSLRGTGGWKDYGVTRGIKDWPAFLRRARRNLPTFSWRLIERTERRIA